MTRTLADEIAEELPGLLRASPAGATIRAIADRLAAGAASVRTAMDVLDGDGRARILRRHGSRALVLVGADDPAHACRVCHGEFERTGKSRRTTCSRPCAVALSWRDPDARERRAAGIRTQRATEEGRANTVERNRKRWARPGERERLGERNRERWADPIAAAETSAALRATNGKPENRERSRAVRQAAWDDPETRERTVEAMRASKARPVARQRASDALRKRWRDPGSRPSLLAATERNRVKAAEASRRARSERPGPGPDGGG